MPLQKINLPINKINFKKCLHLQSVRAILLIVHGDVAQLGEHQVRNLGVEGSIPFVSTILTNKFHRMDMGFKIKGVSSRNA